MSIAISPTTDRAAWLAERRNGIGASEAPAVLGLSPFESATELALRKLGRLPEAEETEAMELGTLMEPVLAELYQRRSGRRIAYQQVHDRHPKHKFLFATVDGIDDQGTIVEFKTTGLHSDAAKDLGEDGTDEVPQHWLIQAHQQMHVFEIRRVVFAVLVGGQSFRQFTVNRNQTLIDAMVPSLEQFWETVQRGEVPQCDATVYTPKILAALNPECDGEFAADEAFVELVGGYEAHKAGEKYHAEKAKEFKAKALQAFGSRQIATLPNGRRVKRYLIPVAERTQTVEAHTQHYFKILKGA